MCGRKRLKPGRDISQLIAARRRRHQEPIAAAPFETMQSGSRKAMRREVIIELCDRSATDDRKRTVEVCFEFLEEPEKIISDVHGIRGCRQFDEAAVKIEKQCPVGTGLGKG